MPSRHSVDLFAIQARCALEDYLSADAFHAKIFSYEAAVRARRADATGPGLVVFPENIGLFLAAEGFGAELAGLQTVDEAFNRLGRKRFLRVLWTMARYRQANEKTGFWLARANTIRDIILRTFSRFALETRTYVVAGSASLPRNRHGLVLRPFSPLDGRVYNLSYTFGPDGRLLAETPKVNLVPTLEDDIGLTPGSPGEVVPVDVGGIKTATAICYDGFKCAHTSDEPGFTPLIPRFDRMGVELVAWPSANPWKWEDGWVFAREGDRRVRREQWMQEGATGLLEGMSKVTYVVNPHLAGDILDLHFEGRSAIYARTAGGYAAVSEAATIDQDEVVHARVTCGERAPLSVTS